MERLSAIQCEREIDADHHHVDSHLKGCDSIHDQDEAVERRDDFDELALWLQPELLLSADRLKRSAHTALVAELPSLRPLRLGMLLLGLHTNRGVQ